ncbi:TetR-like C-terminal domain-containing protein [Streptomyces mirabilis]|uniref:TetR-like C-terminal domain-containing protein n=1 Tax=Streptomyces mirabilis TaxID=68239 RepID=UPI0036BDDA96
MHSLIQETKHADLPVCTQRTLSWARRRCTGTLRDDLVAWFDMLADQIRSKDGPIVAGLFIALLSGPELANQLRPLMATEAPHAGTICLISGWRPSCFLSQSKIRTSRGPKHCAEPLVVATRSVAVSCSAEPDVPCSPPVAQSAAMAGPGGAG